MDRATGTPAALRGRLPEPAGPSPRGLRASEERAPLPTPRAADDWRDGLTAGGGTVVRPVDLRFGVAAVLLTAVAGTVTVAALVGAGPGGGVSDPFAAVGAVTFTATGAVITGTRPRNRIGWILLAIGVAAAAATASAVFGERGLPGWLRQWSPAVSYGLLPLLLLVFPDGHLPGRRWRPVAWLLVAGVLCTSTGFALAALDHSTLLTDPAGGRLSDWAVWPVRVGLVGLCALLAGTVAAPAAAAVRWRRARGDERQQLRWLVPAGAALPAAMALDAASIPGGAVLAGVGVPAAVGAAVIAHRLYDLDLWLNRSVVYTGLCAVLLTGYVGVVLAAEAVLPAVDSRWAAAVATGAVAVAFEPARRRAQHAADRLLYGHRHDPYVVVSDLVRRLEDASAPDQVLPRLAEGVATSLRLSYAAVELRTEDGPLLVAVHGRIAGPPTGFPMVYQGQAVGRLLVGPRTVGRALSAPEHDVLADVARQAGVAARAVRLTADLQRSRERLVTAQEEERRRLRRDLHDGLGPTLAGITMQLGVVSAVGDRTGRVLPALERELQACSDEVRRLVEDLRPPVLDAHGLVEGLDRQLAAFSGGTRFQVDAVIPAPLPAAVEVTAFRIALEAATNVLRHASADSCEIRLRLVAGRLLLEVLDDGVGIEPGHRPGVGLLSMRERATDLGGTCEVTRRAAGGTRVHVELPTDAP